jgi:hypothetical protein
MPTLPQYVAQRRTGQLVRGTIPAPVDVGGLVQGVSNGLSMVADSQLREQDRAARQQQIEQERIERQQQQERERLAHDEAAVHVINAESRMQMRVAESMAEAEQTPGGLAGITAKTLQNFDAWAKEDLDAAPEGAKMMLTKQQARMRGDINARVYGLEMKARMQSVLTDFDAGADDDAKLVFADPSQAAAAIARRKALGNALALPDDVKAKQVAVAVERIAYSAATAIADRDPDGFLRMVGVAGGKTGKDGKPLPSDPEKAAAAVKSNPVLSAMSPEALQRVTERATMLSVTRQAQIDAQRERAARQAEAAQNKAFREATTAFTILDGAVAAGRQLDMTNPQNLHLIKQVNQVPEYAAAFKAGLENLSKNTAVAMQPLPQQKTTLNALYAQRNMKGTSPGLEKEIARVEGVVKEAESAYKNEPLKAAADYGLIPAIAPLDVSSLDATLQGLKVRSSQAQTAAQQKGEAVSPFTSDEAPRIAQQLLALPADQQGTRIAQLTSQMTPQQAQAFAKQIDPQARALSLAMGAGASMTSEGRTVAGLILRGQQTIKDKGIKEDKGDEFGLKATLAKNLGPALSGPLRDAVLDSARYIYLGKAGAGESVTEAGAVALALGGPVVEHMGSRVPVPAGVDLPYVLANYPVNRLPAQVYINGQAIPREAAASALPGAQLEAAGRGKYRVRVGGFLATDEQRRPVLIDVLQ